MGQPKKKVLLASSVKQMLESQGWILYRTFNNEFIFKNDDGEMFSLSHHPKKTNLIYLDDLLRNTPVLHQEFIDAAREEWDLACDPSLQKELQLDIWFDPGAADVSDIQRLLSALSDLNRAVGGFGITLHEAEVVT